MIKKARKKLRKRMLKLMKMIRRRRLTVPQLVHLVTRNLKPKARKEENMQVQLEQTPSILHT